MTHHYFIRIKKWNLMDEGQKHYNMIMWMHIIKFDNWMVKREI